MIRKCKTLWLISIFFILLCACAQTRSVDDRDDRNDRLTVALDLDMPGYFTLNGETFGYQYELLRAYAESEGTELKIVSENTPASYQRLLAEGKLDMATTLREHITGEDNIVIPVYNTSYVILTGRKTARNLTTVPDDPAALLAGKKVLISHGFSASLSYNRLLDSLDRAETYLSSRNCFELLEALSTGKYDFLICEKSVAHLGCALLRNIREVYEFEEEIPVCVLFSRRNAERAGRFRNWLREYGKTEAYALLNTHYFEKGIASEIISRGIRNKKRGAISVYDDVFKRICERENIDWRLVSAIAYNESKFNPYIVSPQGARGLMQIMPSVARQFGMPADSVMEPENNVLLAIRLIRKLDRMMKFSPATGERDRMSIILACYNGGVGHVVDARNLAIKYGENPDSWETVARYLRLKAEEDRYAQDEVVTSGRFYGPDETLAFVSNVMSKYDSYCMRVKR